MNLRQWLKYQGFANFSVVHEKHETFEDKPVSQGGIRIEICEDVASIWCATLKQNHSCVKTTDVKNIVESSLLQLGRLKS